MFTLFQPGKDPQGKPTRRHFLTAGALGVGGLTLAQLLRAEAWAKESGQKPAREKAVINIHLDGGPPHMDMFDLKPTAPVEIRGECRPISTSLPELHMSHLMPRLAARAKHVAFIRSLVGSAGRHDGFQCQSGFRAQDLESLGGRPAVGSVIAKLRGSSQDVAPSFVDLMQGRPLVRNSARPGFLGPAYRPFRPDMDSMFQRQLEPGMVGELARKGEHHTTELKLIAALSERRLASRIDLLGQLDGIRRDMDASGMMDAMDQFTQQAVGILTSGRFADALDLSLEDPRSLARYTVPEGTITARHTTSDEPRAVQKLLLARRLIEAGVRCVSVSFSDFDTHSSNFPRLELLLPMLDFGLSALIDDLQERGMLDDVVIVAWGEFGRTPKIDAKTGGRHHWPAVGPAMIAGGGLHTGQIIGSTDRTASEVRNRPVHYQDVLATLYHVIGIDSSRTTITDPSGRPQYLLDEGRPIEELV